MRGNGLLHRKGTSGVFVVEFTGLSFALALGMNSRNTHLAIQFNDSDNQSDVIRTVGYTRRATVGLGEGVGVDTNRGVCRQGNGNVLLCTLAACFASSIGNADNGRNGSVRSGYAVSCISDIGAGQGGESKRNDLG